MRKMRYGLGVLGFVLISVGTVAANSSGLPFWLRLIRTLSVRIDTLQARMDAHDEPSSALASLDKVEMTDATTAYVAGWALACKDTMAAPQSAVRAPDYLYYRTAVVVDSIEISLEPTARPERDDVTNILATHCMAFGGSLTTPAGLEYAIDLKPFGTGQHRIQIRVYDDEGRAFTSNNKFVQIEP